MRSDEKPSTKQNGKKCARSNKIARSLPLSLSPYLSPSLSLLLSLSLANWRAFVSVSDSLCVSFVSERLLRTDVFKNALACHAPFERLLVKKYATAY